MTLKQGRNLDHGKLDSPLSYEYLSFIHFGFLTFSDILYRLCIVLMIFESFEPIQTELNHLMRLLSKVEIWIVVCLTRPHPQNRFKPSDDLRS